MVLHVLLDRAGAGLPPAAGPRAGFVVGRAVGNSVVRHRVTRQLRAAARELLPRVPQTTDLVVRARPEAATAGFEALRHDLATGLDRVLSAPVRP
jgi:ribonuclease P protein component